MTQLSDPWPSCLLFPTEGIFFISYQFFSCTPLQKLSKTASKYIKIQAVFDNFRNGVQEKKSAYFNSHMLLICVISSPEPLANVELL